MKTSALFVLLALAACTPPAWQTRCQRYGCDYAAWNYCDAHCEKRGRSGACERYDECHEIGETCTQFRGVTREALEHHNSGERR